MHKPLKTRLRLREANSGFSLIELLVSVVIGLLLAVAGSAAYLYSKQAYNSVSETSEMEQNGRFALTLLTRYVQSAGFVMLNPGSIAIQGAEGIKLTGCNFGIVNGQTPSAASDLNCRTAIPSGERPSESISMFFDTDAPNNTGALFQGFDCIGNNSVGVAQINENGGTFTRYPIRSNFFVAQTTATTANGSVSMGQLSCLADATPPTGGAVSFQVQPLIPGVEQLAVNYLLPYTPTVAGEFPKLAQTALTADAVSAAARWGEVMAVELCVLTKSVQPSGSDSGTQYTDCYGTVITTTRNESFRTFRTTVNLRNRTPA
jgi:type IV pilus assembly protein PilW